MPGLPTGTVTFLFTDIEGSTRLLQDLGGRYAQILADQRRLLRAAFQSRGGHEVSTEGDAFFVVFPRAKDAAEAAVAAQHALASHPWPEGAEVRLRMGLHTGEPLSTDIGYVGIDVHQAARICSAGHGGQILISDTTFALIAKDLPEGVSLRDLGEHRLKDLAHPHRLFQVMAADLPANFPPLKSLNVLPNNLPLQLTSFIGRRREIADIKTILATTRLLTLTGAGGSGKTRLALQVGVDLLELYADGVWFVDLAALADLALVPQTVASALGVLEQPRRALTEILLDALRPKSLLLLLDNCEHLLAACAGLADVLLRGCPKLRILVTSRESLGIAGETLFPVPTLSLPNPEQLPSIEDLVQYESVRLFTERAAAVLPTFRVTPQNAKSVVQICHHLDGIPLAIELAAVRVKMLALDQIVARLGDRFRLLTGGSRTAPPRHQTMQAAIDWSYGLLSEKEEIMLRQLSVFAGGCALDAAEAVWLGNDARNTGFFDLLGQLVDKSLVVAETQHGEARYRLLESIRQYARQKLVDSGESAEVQERHFNWYLALAERAESKLPSGFVGELPGRFVGESDQVVWLENLEREHDNLRAALDWSIMKGGAEESLRLATALCEFWEIRGYLSEGLEWLLRVIERAREGASPALHAKALYVAGRLTQWQTEFSVALCYYEQSLKIRRDLRDKDGVARSLRAMAAMMVWRGDLSAEPLLEESLMIFRELGQMNGVAATLANLGNLARLQGDYAKARRLTEESLAIFRKLGDTTGIAWALRYLGQATEDLGSLSSARRSFEESLAIFQQLGEQLGIGWALGGIGEVAWLMGDNEAAGSLFEESFAIFDKLGHRQGIGWALSHRGHIALLQGDYAKAEALYGKGLMLLKEVGDKLGVLSSLGGLAGVAWACQHPTRAVRLYGAAEAQRDAAGVTLSRVNWPDCDRIILDVRDRLGQEAFSAAWAEGRAMTLEQAVEYALNTGEVERNPS